MKVAVIGTSPTYDKWGVDVIASHNNWTVREKVPLKAARGSFECYGNQFVWVAGLQHAQGQVFDAILELTDSGNISGYREVMDYLHNQGVSIYL